MPDGSGAVNPKGLDFYDRLVDAMLERGIRPFATLFHWDLPQALQDRGGWTNRATMDAFVRYADVVTGASGDRVKDWMTHNEPWVVAFVRPPLRRPCPGPQRPPDGAGRGARHPPFPRPRGPGDPRQLPRGARRASSTTSSGWSRASDREEDVAAAMRHDGAFNRWFLDPVFRGKLPGGHAGVVRRPMPRGRSRETWRPSRRPWISSA